MSAPFTSPRTLMSLLMGASMLVACGAQGAETPIRNQDISRAALSSTLVEIAFSPKQQAVFVSAPDWKQETQSRVLRLDPATLKIEAEIPQKVKGFGVALDDAENRLYLTQGFDGTVGVVDTATNRNLAEIALQNKVNLEQAYRAAGLQGEKLDFLLAELKRFKLTDDYLYKIREVKFDAKTGRLFLPGLGYGVESVLFVVDTKAGKLEKVIPGFGFYAVGIALDEQGRRVFVSNMQGQLMTLNADTLALTSVKEIDADQLLNLVYDPTSNRVMGVDQGIDRDKYRNHYLDTTYTRRSTGHKLYVLDADSGKTLASAETDEVPIGLLLDQKNQRIYVTNRNGVREEHGKGTLAVFDAKTLKRIQTLPLPPHPNSLTLDSKANVLYVTVKNDIAGTKAGEKESVVRIQQ